RPIRALGARRGNVDEGAPSRGEVPASSPESASPPHPAPPPAPPPPPGPRRRHPWRWVAAWGIAVVVVAGLTVPALIATEAAGRAASPDLERYVPMQPGSLSVFATRTDGKDSGLLFEQVLGQAQVVALAPDTVAVGDLFANFEGLGRPLDIRSYLA